MQVVTLVGKAGGGNKVDPAIVGRHALHGLVDLGEDVGALRTPIRQEVAQTAHQEGNVITKTQLFAHRFKDMGAAFLI